MPYFLPVRAENQKSWETGIFNYYLAQIYANEKITKVNKTAKARANHLLNVQKNYKSFPPTADGRAFLSVEDYLTHQIRECLVIIHKGVTTPSSRNKYAKALLRGLDERQRPTYWLKTMHIIQCINDVLTYEIYLFMTEKLLKYETSFFASTYDFWWDRVHKKSFGA